MAYWQLFYHLVWTTREREALIDEAVQQIVRRSILTTCKEQGVVLHGLGMMPDHVHVAASIPPRVAVAPVVGRLKGAASHAVNDVARRGHGEGAFAWQAEYGAFWAEGPA